MTIKDELREQFSFLRRQPYENKKEYKRRVLERGQELFDGINCTLDESIRFRALSNCRAVVLITNDDGKQMILGDINLEEYALKKGNAKDFEKFVDLIFFVSFNTSLSSLFNIAISFFVCAPNSFAFTLL